MAIQFQGNNIIKMYYGGNAITQAYLNEDYFFPVSETYYQSGIVNPSNDVYEFSTDFVPDVLFLYPNEVTGDFSAFSDIRMSNPFDTYNNDNPWYGKNIYMLSGNIEYSDYTSNPLTSVNHSIPASGFTGECTYFAYKKGGDMYNTGTTEISDGTITITDLPNRPNVILAYKTTNTTDARAEAIIFRDSVVNSDLLNVKGYDFYYYNGEYFNNALTDNGNITIGDNSFSVSQLQNGTYTWHVWYN